MRRSAFTWNDTIRGFVAKCQYRKSIITYRQMIKQGIKPDGYTFPVVIKACGLLRKLEFGKHVHHDVVVHGHNSNMFISCSLISMYGKCGSYELSRRVFDKMPERTGISWIAMINAYFSNGRYDEVVELFFRMLELDKQVRADWDLLSVLMPWVMASISSVNDAHKVFGVAKCVIRDSDHAAIRMYAKCGRMDLARKIFDGISSKGVYIWASMIEEYARADLPLNSLDLLKQMMLQNVLPDPGALLCVVRACSVLASLQCAYAVHGIVIRTGGLDEDSLAMESALIDLYVKCGSLTYARKVFDRMEDRYPISWSTILSGWMHGHGKEQLELNEANKYIKLVKEQDLRWLQKLRGEKEKGVSTFNVDPFLLNFGDYVVHKNVGIGRFAGIKIGVSKGCSELSEHVFIEYADGIAKLPVTEASRMLYRYSLPNGNTKPKVLSKLRNTSTWEKRKTKRKIQIQNMVVDLMELYLHRMKQTRPPYPKSPAMAEFVAQFPYEPTPDQVQAFNDVERDLTERKIPMDRLICGDVGFGKTEVALRAIFCVVSAGKQAMVLAPTRALARQHFKVISKRFSNFSHIKVGLLNRFQTKAEREKYFDMIKQGDMNIIVGTHSLLGSGVVYDNIGLLVVDEEQRFGVKQKEKIAALKSSVDILTLSATPIPRTLYLALNGFRNVSLISTPPPDRIPIKTFISEYSEIKVISAIKYELDRGGQVYYVLPRIEGLKKVMDLLQHSFPKVQTAIVHGQQSSNELEDAMEKFAEGKIKILICTNIVETGLDIQNANTIVIHGVQQFGLSQLYQLRGRVGRADKEAYAYLFYPDESVLSSNALARHSALEECKGLGQGFRLAERDMDIRGFGTIFGERQTGNFGDIGISLFFAMLFESLSKVEEHQVDAVPYESVQIDLNVNPCLPSELINYLKNPTEIISQAEKATEKDIWSLMQFTQNLRRRHGKEPYSLEILLTKLYIRRMAADLGITRIYVSGKMVGMKTNPSNMVFKLMMASMTSDVQRRPLVFDGDQIKAELQLELPSEELLKWIFRCLAEFHASIPASKSF